ncbi:MAG: hypothetical protein HY318_02110 [Armatimonadetes bacterium]|nr:hypothetical protein [Armatimonadota bacterium]
MTDQSGPPDNKRTQRKYADFRLGYLWASLGVAIFAGLAIGGHLIFVIAYGYAVGPGFSCFIQVHGHVQLMGWTGLFIIGVSLHFLPRAAGVPLAKPHQMRYPLWLITVGLLLRTFAHCALPYLSGSPAFTLCSWAVAISGLLEWIGVFTYLRLLLGTHLQSRRLGDRPGLRAIEPFMAMMALGWLLYSTINAVLVVQMALQKAALANMMWSQIATEAFIDLALLPVAFAFSVRTFPLYLRLAAPDWPVATVAYVYLVGVCLHLVPVLPPFLSLASDVPDKISLIGKTVSAGAILWFVWSLDVLTRLKAPWIVNRIGHPGPDRRTTRPGLPDYGEFGHFEWLVYSAYLWLVLGAAVEAIQGVFSMAGRPLPVNESGVRHLYLLGFTTLLILGMAPRMVPGFLHKKRVASPGLVDLTFWLGNTALIGRELMLWIPPFILNSAPVTMGVAQALLGFSGMLSMVTLACLALNLWLTARRQ